jgi:hypothetical protein
MRVVESLGDLVRRGNLDIAIHNVVSRSVIMRTTADAGSLSARLNPFAQDDVQRVTGSAQHQVPTRKRNGYQLLTVKKHDQLDSKPIRPPHILPGFGMPSRDMQNRGSDIGDHRSVSVAQPLHTCFPAFGPDFDGGTFGSGLHCFLAEQFPTPSRYERPDDGVESAGSIVYVGVPST